MIPAMNSATAAIELARIYEHLQLNLECIRKMLTTVDALTRTILGVEQLAESFQAKLADGQCLANTAEAIKQVDLALYAIGLQSDRFR
ncbi:MAG: hypothetical protein ABSE56_03050 [Bryobacteraceae bacterium]|jgi:translation initiation factor 1 (eIF-1/SUI1)